MNKGKIHVVVETAQNPVEEINNPLYSYKFGNPEVAHILTLRYHLQDYIY